MNDTEMLYFGKIDVSKVTDVNTTSATKNCDIFHYWYFLNFSFKFQPSVSNRRHNLLMISVNFSDIAILNIKGSDYLRIMSLISKNEVINADLTEKSRTL